MGIPAIPPGAPGVRFATGGGLQANPVPIASFTQSLNRAPTVLDNTSLGYSATSVWQAKGLVYKPVGTPDAVSTVWQVQTTAPSNFVDIVGAAAAIFIGGLIVEKPGYAGPLCDISVTIATVATTFTLRAAANGRFDEATFQAYEALADAGTFVTCIKLYNQNILGSDAVKITANPAPYIAYSDALGGYALQFEGKTTTPRVLQLPAGVITTGSLTSGFGVIGNAWSTYVYGCGMSSSVNAGGMEAWGLGDMLNPTSADRRFLTNFLQNTGEVQHWRNGSQIATTPKIMVDLQAHVMINAVNTTTAYMSVNEDIGSVAASNDTAVYTSGYIGAYRPDLSSTSSHMIVSFGVANIAMTTTQQTSLRYSAYAKYDIRPQVLDQTFLTGDSRTAQARPFTQRYNSVGLQFVARIGKASRVYACGNENMTSAGMLTTSIAFIITKFKTGVTNQVFHLSGVNDFIVSNETAAQSLADIQANTLALKNAGFRVNVLNEIATTNTTNAANTRMVTLRALISALSPAAMNADTIIDLGQYTPFLTPANTAYYQDGLHGTQELDIVWGAALVPYSQLSAVYVINDQANPASKYPPKTGGIVGDYLSSTIAVGSAVSLTTATTANVTSITLTAGDWDVSGVLDFHPGVTTATTYIQGGSSTTSATMGAQDASFSQPVAIATTAVDAAEPIPVFRYSVAPGATQVVYLVVTAGFTISTLTAYGTLRARRWR